MAGAGNGGGRMQGVGRAGRRAILLEMHRFTTTHEDCRKLTSTAEAFPKTVDHSHKPYDEYSKDTCKHRSI